MLSVFAATLAPWAWRNTKLEQTFITVDSMGGRNVLMGNYRYTPLFRSWDAISLRGERAWTYDLRAGFPPSDWRTPGLLDKLALREGMRFIREHPGLTMKRDAVKFCQFWGLERELVAAASRDYYGPLPSVTLVLVTLAIFASYAAVALTGVFGVVMAPSAPSADRRFRRLVLLVILFIWAIHTVVFAHSRYHLPAVVLLLPFSAAAVSDAREIWRRRGTPAWWCACATSCLLVLIWTLEIFVLDRARFSTLVHFS
jgi:hypothetical protein